MIGRGYRKWTVAESEAYRLEADTWGNYTLTRRADGHTLFFQGGDGLEVESEVEADGFDLDRWADQYDGCVTFDAP
jgi:hypothetical protein